MPVVHCRRDRTSARRSARLPRDRATGASSSACRSRAVADDERRGEEPLPLERHAGRRQPASSATRPVAEDGEQRFRVVARRLAPARRSARAFASPSATPCRAPHSRGRARPRRASTASCVRFEPQHAERASPDDQVEAVVGGTSVERELRSSRTARRACGERLRDERSARRRRQIAAPRLAHIGDEREPPGAGHAEPGAAGLRSRPPSQPSSHQRAGAAGRA